MDQFPLHNFIHLDFIMLINLHLHQSIFLLVNPLYDSSISIHKYMYVVYILL